MMVFLDVALLVLATLRLTRLMTTDDLPGQWWIYGPLYKRAHRHPARKTPWWAKYLSGLTCPFCVGFWVGLAVLLSLLLVGGPGDAPDWWRWASGAFALNYVVGMFRAVWTEIEGWRDALTDGETVRWLVRGVLLAATAAVLALVVTGAAGPVVGVLGASLGALVVLLAWLRAHGGP
jgi:hypothetical protein